MTTSVKEGHNGRCVATTNLRKHNFSRTSKQAQQKLKQHVPQAGAIERRTGLHGNTAAHALAVAATAVIAIDPARSRARRQFIQNQSNRQAVSVPKAVEGWLRTVWLDALA